MENAEKIALHDMNGQLNIVIKNDIQAFLDEENPKKRKYLAKNMISNAASITNTIEPRIVLLKTHTRLRKGKKSNVLMMFFNYHEDANEDIKDFIGEYDIYWGGCNYPCWCAVVTDKNKDAITDDLLHIFTDYFEKIVDIDNNLIINNPSPDYAYVEAPAYRLLPFSCRVSIKEIERELLTEYPEKTFDIKNLCLLLWDRFEKNDRDEFFTRHPFIVFRLSQYYFWYSTVGQCICGLGYQNNRLTKQVIARGIESIKINHQHPVIEESASSADNSTDLGIPFDAQSIIDKILIDLPIAVINSNYVCLDSFGLGADAGLNKSLLCAYVPYGNEIFEKIARGLNDSRINYNAETLHTIVFADSYINKTLHDSANKEEAEYLLSLVLIHEVAHILAAIHDDVLSRENNNHGVLWSCYSDALLYIFLGGEYSGTSIEFERYARNWEIIYQCEAIMEEIIEKLPLKRISVSDLIEIVGSAYNYVFEL